ncbi:hypothetical protein GDO86_016421 [Hymenochirus boettgeri]|uniref:Myb/SANT-like DNA-binding domain-containing protein n=1 Tax=Hymenochirus boettgeri TaxID=247094 RepID=A0A8T2K565_9PIPI|nr:hypothetical protein GDO86_016421 [Hymenochirus boettgeri]
MAEQWSLKVEECSTDVLEERGVKVEECSTGDLKVRGIKLEEINSDDLEDWGSLVDGIFLRRNEKIEPEARNNEEKEPEARKSEEKEPKAWNSEEKKKKKQEVIKQKGPRRRRQAYLRCRSSPCSDRLRNMKFTEDENDVLVTKVMENYRKLYGDDASRTSSFEKKRIWRGILDSVNRLGVSVRNVDNCKKRFADCKRFVRTKMNRNRHHGGKRPPLNVYYAEWEEKIKEIVCPLGDVIPGVIDSADPCTYEGPGHWSSQGNTTPEAQLSPEENFTPDVPVLFDTRMQTEPETQAANKESRASRKHKDLSVEVEVEVEEEEEESSSQEESDHQHSTEEADLPEMEQLLLKGQEFFRQTLRRQLHSVRQEVRDFKREHTKRMDSLLTLHREHLIVEEQRNEILSQLVATVNNLATSLNTGDAGKTQQNTQPSIAATSASTGENSTMKGSSGNAITQSVDDVRNNAKKFIKTFSWYYGYNTNKRTK